MRNATAVMMVLVMCGAGAAHADLIHQYDPSTDTWDDQAGHAVGDVDLTPQNGASIDTSAGYFSKAFTFDGTDDAASGGSYKDDYSDLTIEMWVKFDALTDSTGDNQVLFEHGDGKGLAIFLDDDGLLTFKQGKKTDNEVTVSSDLTALSSQAKGDFIQIVAIIDQDTETRLLVNGGNKVTAGILSGNYPQEANGDTGLGGPSSDGKVGGYSGMTGEPSWETLDGQVGIVNVYDNALTDTEVATAFNAIIPEPATMSLLALGGLGVLIRRKK